IWFYIPVDRLVLVNVSEIIRVTFCIDSPRGVVPRYCDNFNFSEEMQSAPDELEEGVEFELPRLIVSHRRAGEEEELVEGVTMKTGGYFGNVSGYSGVGEGDIRGLNFGCVNKEEGPFLITGRYLQFLDDDGEANFMP